MIRFCDKEVYNVYEGDMTRNQLLSFFLHNEVNRLSVIAIYEKNGKLKGTLTYNELLEFDSLDECININTLLVTENFWDDARAVFKDYNRKLVAVVKNNDILGFAYNDSSDEGKFIFFDCLLSTLEEADFFLPEKYNKVKMVIITDLNELAWRCYQLFKKKGYKVSVLGEEWEWFGLKSGKGYLDYPNYAKPELFTE